MKRFWKVAGIATLVAVLGVVAVGTVAYAQDDGSGGPFDFGGRFREAVAGILGISVEEYDAAVEQAQAQVVDEALAEGWLTEDQAERMQERIDEGLGMRGMDRGWMGRGMDFMRRGGDSIVGLIAEELDMSVRDLLAELEDGQTLGELASEKGVDVEAITATYLAELEANLAQAVEDGKITQTQADWMLEQATERVPDLLDNTWEGDLHRGFPGGGRPGGIRGFPGQTDV
jgi:hypothetical protein